MLRRAGVVWLLVAVGITSPLGLQAAQIDLSLNVFYTNPTDSLSGGTWRLAAKSDEQGISAIIVRLSDITLNSAIAAGPRGVVNGDDAAGFSVFTRFLSMPGVTELSMGQHALSPEEVLGGEQTLFYGVGTIENGEPGDVGPTPSSLTSEMNIPWATGDDFSDSDWDTAAILASGSFAAGMIPAFAGTQTGNIFTSAGSSTVPGSVSPLSSGNGEITTVVRDNLSEFLLGDYNQDGKVSAADYTVWRDTLGSMTDLRANGDNIGPSMDLIDEADYDVWIANYGMGSGAGSGSSAQAAAAVPEPSAGLLAVLGFLFLAHFYVWNGRRSDLMKNP